MKFICECGYNFESEETWNCWELINSEVICPKCKQEYFIEYDAVEKEDVNESSDTWNLKKIN